MDSNLCPDHYDYGEALEPQPQPPTLLLQSSVPPLPHVPPNPPSPSSSSSSDSDVLGTYVESDHIIKLSLIHLHFIDALLAELPQGVRALISKLLQANRTLKEENRQLKEVIRQLQEK